MATRKELVEMLGKADGVNSDPRPVGGDHGILHFQKTPSYSAH